MDAESRQIIEETLAGCAQALFDHYGVTLTPEAGEDLEDLTIATVVGFSEESARGSIVLRTHDNVVLHSRPLDNTCLDDWLGELGNQFIGRLKRRLSRYGVAFDLGVPTTLRGDKLRFSWGLKSLTFKARLTGELGTVELLLGVLFDASPWHLVSQELGEQMTSGDLVLF